MLINRTGESYVYETTTYTIGEKIYANENSDWEGLFGFITEIRTDEDRETENETPDIYCSFEPPVLPEDIVELEKRFSVLYGEPKKLEDISLDEVIMAPEMIDKFIPCEELTDQYFQKRIYETYRNKGVKEDVISKVERDPELGKIPDDVLQRICNEPHLADRFDAILGKSGQYWMIYWNSIEQLISELLEQYSQEREEEAV